MHFPTLPILIQALSQGYMSSFCVETQTHRKSQVSTSLQAWMAWNRYHQSKSCKE